MNRKKLTTLDIENSKINNKKSFCLENFYLYVNLQIISTNKDANKNKIFSSNHITQRLKMKISTLFSAFVAVYGQVSMQTYDTCKIRRWQNFKGIFQRHFFTTDNSIDQFQVFYINYSKIECENNF